MLNENFQVRSTLRQNLPPRSMLLLELPTGHRGNVRELTF